MAHKLIKLGFVLLGLCAVAGVDAHSAKALGMGDAGVAYPQDSLSVVYNPANAAEVGNRWDSVAGAVYDPYSAKISNNPNPAANKHSYGRRTWNPYGAFGINKCLGYGWAANFAFSNRFFHKTHYNKPSVLAGTTRLGHGYEKYAASSTIAYKSAPFSYNGFSFGTWCFGASLDVLVGRHKEIGVQNFDSPTFSVAPGHVTNRGYDWNWGLGLSVGALWEITECLKLGVRFSPETKMSRFHKYKGIIPQWGRVHNNQEFHVGFSFRFRPCATFIYEYFYAWTRRLRAVRNPTVFNPFIVLLGSEHGSSYGLRNTSAHKFGLDYAVCENLIARIGYIYAPETNRRSQAFLDVIWNVPEENFLTLGATMQYKCWELDAFFVHGFERKVKGPIPLFEGGGKVWHKRSINVFGLGISKPF